PDIAFASATIFYACSVRFAYSFFSFYHPAAHGDLHSFPTRRSSDLHRPSEGRSLLRAGIGIGDRYVGKPMGRHAFEMRPSHLVQDRKSTRLNSSHVAISYAVFCLKKKNDYPPDYI